MPYLSDINIENIPLMKYSELGNVLDGVPLRDLRRFFPASPANQLPPPPSWRGFFNSLNSISTRFAMKMATAWTNFAAPTVPASWGFSGG
jgi:hypothetical protein